ncbi:hypothetical protein JCM10450v2_006653 [Rhodotorula kratochvilovae]
MSVTLRTLAVAAAFAATASAHLDLNYPTSSWDLTEEQQEQGGVCGGGSRVAAVAWGTEGAFVSLSGDEGHSVRILLASTNSMTENTTIADASSFPIVLSEGASFSSSGNLCLPVALPTNYTSGARATLYVEATGEGETVSSCAEVVLVPANSGSSVVIEHGAAVVNPETGANMTVADYYCSNSTIAALDTCSCHCHGDSEHCDESCSAERVSAAAQECAAPASSSSAASSGAPSASASQTPAASGTVGQEAAAESQGGSSGAGSLQVGGVVAAMLAVAGAAVLA